MSRVLALAGLAALSLAACGDSPPPAPPPPAGSFAFGVFGDGPYRSWENGRYRRLLKDVSRADVAWLLHVGDILWYPCSDQVYEQRRALMNTVRHPVVYTPGDNEWTDCHQRVAGAYPPLDRLRAIRRTFFPEPGKSLGGRPMALESQAADTAFAEFVENARWRRGGFLFATVHVVGSGNGSEAFEGRTAADDAEVARRRAAALAWLGESFRLAAAERAKGLVLALHADPGFEWTAEGRAPFQELLDRLVGLTRGFPGQVLLIHGDSHQYRVDQPLVDPETRRPLPNFTRLETFGSPDIGWVRVVVDTVAGRFTRFEPQLTSSWRLW